MISNCPHCGDAQLQRLPGKGPHTAALKCSRGHFIKWLSAGQLEALGGFTHEQLSVLDKC
jgi:hypothetical protein